jgi:hypothetical protein
MPKMRAKGMMVRSALNNSYVNWWQNRSTFGDDGHDQQALRTSRRILVVENSQIKKEQ